MIQFQGAIWMSPEPYEWRVGERSVSPLIGIAEMDKEAFIGESQAISGSPFRR